MHRYFNRIKSWRWKGIIKLEDISKYLRIPCPHCDHKSVILEYLGNDPIDVKMLGYDMFRCPRCEVCMSFEECERYRMEMIMESIKE